MATIAENLQTILDIKNDIKSAIIAKGVSVADDDGFATYPDKIESIESGGGNLEEKTIAVVSNGTQTILPNDGFDGLSSVKLNVAITDGASALNFSLIDYDTEFSAEINAKYNDDIAYSKSILDKWNPDRTSASTYFLDNTKLVFCPNIDTSKIQDMGVMFANCAKLIVVPQLNTANVVHMPSMFSACSSLETIPLFNTSNVTDMSNMFISCSSLTHIPQLDTSKVKKMTYMFQSCKLLTSIPLLDTSNVTDMSYMLSVCPSLTHIPQLDTSKVTNMGSMFSSCTSLTTIPPIDTSNVTNMSSMFGSCTKLQSLPLLDCSSVTNISAFFGYSNINTLTELGGFKNLKTSWTGYGSLNALPNLTYESVMNIINNLYDFRGNGDTSTTRTIQFNANSKALLSDEDIALATNKGWVIS